MSRKCFLTHLRSFVTKEVDCVVLRQEFEAETLIPASGENVDANLPTDGKLDVTVSEFLSHRLHHCFTDLVFLQKRGKSNEEM